jgi:phosphoribosyl-dephospho-CoA transferase
MKPRPLFKLTRDKAISESEIPVVQVMNQSALRAAAVSGEIQPHDLLRINGAEALLSDVALPDWARAEMTRASMVVVRRAPIVGDLIPVGVRGRLRSERCAAFVQLKYVLQRVKPEDLVVQRRWSGNPRTSVVPAMRAIEKIAQEWPFPERAWGPTGSVGFELATGVHSATFESDLDLVIRAHERLSNEDAETLLKTVSHQGVSVDIQVETPLGSVSLREFALPSSKQILVKTCNGPKLVTDPWTLEEGGLK